MMYILSFRGDRICSMLALIKALFQELFFRRGVVGVATLKNAKKCVLFGWKFV